MTLMPQVGVPVPVVAIFALDDLVEVLLDLGPVPAAFPDIVDDIDGDGDEIRDRFFDGLGDDRFIFCGHARFSFLAPLVR